ncbi:AAA domain-containing protein [Actinoplanes sp. N902-109]|uniref:AAA domain-containing protein n=1 Tax=Actinoplanes sp. (strain N902-109) TaxID=649831 RepID=UPI0006843CD9|nr:AAA domain-containing protein [Actinoplanes sp. N902-109]
MQTLTQQTNQATHLDRAVRLFEFLARAQQATLTPARTYDGCRVAWADELPRHPAVQFAHWSDAPGPGEEIGHLDRVAASGDDDQPVRDAYATLFAMQAEAAANPEEQELVLAVGCLVWQPEGHPAVRRHLVTTPVTVDLEPVSGTLRIHAVETAGALRVELDMLDPELTGSRHLAEAREAARGYTDHPLHRKAIGEVLHRIANSLDPDAQYTESEPPGRTATGTAEVSLAPAIVLRRRDRQGVVELLDTIRTQLLAAQSVPPGLLPLVDPDHRPRVRADPTPGAMVTVDDEVFLPLPVNEQQLEILRQVDRHAQTLVQGPPGTGKTHTAAALLSHLLAQGKRVLVTAQTERALKEVRAKLPEAIRPLSVAVVGASREDLTDLKVAVETISQRAVDYDEQRYSRTIEHHLMAVDKLRRHLAGVKRRMADVRCAEITRHERGPYRGTLAAIAAAHRVDEPRYGWIRAWTPSTLDDEPPLSAVKMTEWLRLLRDGTLSADGSSAYDTLPDPGTLVSPAAFAAAVQAESEAWQGFQMFQEHTRLSSYAKVRSLPGLERQQVQRLAAVAAELARDCPGWMSKALLDARTWRDKATQVRHLIDQAELPATLLGSTAIDAPAGELPALVAQAQQLRDHLSAGGRVKTGLLAAKPVKAAKDLLASVRVDQRPPESAEAVEVFLAWAKLQPLLKNLNHAWPGSTPRRLDEHKATLEQLDRVLALGAALDRLGLPAAHLDEINVYAVMVDAATAADRLDAARLAVEAAATPIAALLHEPQPSPVLPEALAAVQARDALAYSAATHRLVRLIEIRALVTHRDNLAALLARQAPALRDAIAATPADPAWDERLAGWEAAWAWLTTGAWLNRQRPADLNRLQREATETETAIRGHVEELAAARAWRHAAAPDRITGSARANLQQYGQLVRRLGKGTAKYAPQRRAEIRQAMDRCRPSVPVWIMPIYRVAEQLRVQPDMFDVVIVDEASQAGLSATFLQYIAPTIVVIGDDRQVSPSAVGVDQQDLRNLAAQYLHDDPYRASWQDPQRSLFDEAKMRFSGQIPLVEHRRCVPEIIEFSNRIAYEPERIRLVPVRQYGVDRLDPVRAVFVNDGFVRGTTDKTNPPEAEAIVEQICACVADPRYAGRTFGVISLRGPHQAKLIENLLLQRLDPAEWARRDLRCGDSADFQGSERDVMFLSMVTAVVPGQRLSSATTETYLQRYNVAASRARDQMWVFHSVRAADIDDPEDLRHQLLDYCAEVAAGAVTGPVATVEPFRSPFERDVHDRLTGRGFSVVRHYEHLVVVGADGRLAVVCDGDTWSGPDRYEADMARQRELGRCGWEFFRIAQSAWVLDEAAVLRDLSAALDRRGIRPAGG